MCNYTWIILRSSSLLLLVMNFDELRPLKRPKLGLPDIYPQETRQKEVWLMLIICIHVIYIPL